MPSAAFWRAWWIWAVLGGDLHRPWLHRGTSPARERGATRLKDAVDFDSVRDELANVVEAALETTRLWVWTSGRD